MAPLPTYDEVPRGDLAPGARRAAVLGRPIGHSLSPALHRAAYDALGLDWVYGRGDAGVEDVEALLAALDDEWAGLSLTMPLKHAVLPHLDVVDELAEVVGVVNTVLVQPGARGARPVLVGANTDVYGVVAALREVAPEGWRPHDAVVLGAGATAASTLAALGQLGATAPVVVARSVARATSTLQAGRRMGVEVTLRPWSDAVAAVARADVVVSTVPAGGADELATALAAEPGVGATTSSPERREAVATGAMRAGAVLLDVAYDPWPSPLARVWAEAGGVVAPGWGMLLHQGAEQVRLMTGRVAPVTAMRAAIEEALARH